MRISLQTIFYLRRTTVEKSWQIYIKLARVP